MCLETTPRTHIRYFLLFQIVCEVKSAFALGCAASRVFPLYSRKTPADTKNTEVIVEFVFVDDKSHKLSADDVNCLTASAQSIRLTAKIVDMPCNEMHVNAFLNVS